MIPAPLTSYGDGCILVIRYVDGSAQERLRDIGIREGACVEMIKNSEGLIVRLEGSRIGLRRDMAEEIFATPLIP
ncbi:MAG: FeoA family protein [Bacteroidetes bacterium]|nr:FeoA family protein [Bacteroidota bacterium]MCY4205834.1 FeoA family protein [Bacteroidota bacterium]